MKSDENEGRFDESDKLKPLQRIMIKKLIESSKEKAAQQEKLRSKLLSLKQEDTDEVHTIYSDFI